MERNIMNRNKDHDTTFTEIARRQERIINNVCFFYASSELPFDDLRQEVLISLFKSLPHFKDLASESTWVYRVAINTCLFAMRKFKAKIKTVSIEDLPHLQMSDQNNEELKVQLEWLYDAISGLNPIDKAIIIMWLDDLSYEEIASNMGMPRNTVATRLHRIKEKLSSKKDK